MPRITKKDRAEKILSNLKETLLQILWDENGFDYCGARFLMPWLQEEAEYEIKNLKFKSPEEKIYIRKIDRIIGEYAEYYEKPVSSL